MAARVLFGNVITHAGAAHKLEPPRGRLSVSEFMTHQHDLFVAPINKEKWWGNSISARRATLPLIKFGKRNHRDIKVLAAVSSRALPVT